jgi:transcriptional regulator with XRE-family HTH domain
MGDIKKTIGNRLRDLRNEYGWSQEELAHRAEISPSHMGRLERGERGATIHSLEKVTNALGITFEELFRFLNPEYENKDNAILYALVQKLSKRSLRDKKIILNLIDSLPPWESDK